MPIITSTPSKQTLYNRAWRAKHTALYCDHIDGLCEWRKESRRFLRILDDFSGRLPQGRPRKEQIV